jgi:hypothetical protein
VGAFSEPLRLTGRLLELWAARLDCADDDILGHAYSSEVIPLRAERGNAQGGPAEDAAEQTPLRRTAGRRDSQ